MNLRLKNFLKTLPAILWMAMIFQFSHQPGGGSGALSRLIMGYLAEIGINFQAWFGDHAVWVLRKCAHFTEYCLLFFLLLLAFTIRWEWKTSRWWALLGTFLYACSDEFHQLFIPGRVGDAFDVLIDTSGGIFGLLVISLMGWMRSKRKSVPSIS